MWDKGFSDPEVTHDVVPLPPKRFAPNAVRLTISVIEGPRSKAGKSKRSGKLLLTPSQRCDR